MQYVISFLEGMITFLSPCLLPMLPVYLSYFAGGEGRSRDTVKGALGFVAGFTAVFVLMGMLAGTIGGFLRAYAGWVNLVAGLIVVFFGLLFLGVFRLRLFQGVQPTTAANRRGFISSAVFGMAFSIGWTPCVGAFLGSALMMASSQGHALEGMVLLLLYSLGLGVPFVLSALLLDYLKSAFDWIKRHYAVIQTVSGCLLILLGVLMATGVFGWLIGLLS